MDPKENSNEETILSDRIKPGSLVAFYFVILLCLQVPEIFNQYFHHAIPRITVFFIPPLIAILLFNLIGLSDLSVLRLNLDQSDYFFLLFISGLTIIELGHSALNGTNPSFDIILQYLWLYVLYYTVRSFDVLFEIRRVVVLAAIQIISLLSVIQIAGYLGLLDLGAPAFHLFRERPDIFNVNSGSYYGVFLFFLWSFCLPTDLTRHQKIIHGILLIPGIVLILLNQTRGAFLLLIILMVIKNMSKLQITAKIAIVSVFAFVILSGGIMEKQNYFSNVTRYISLGRGLTYEQEKEVRGLSAKSDKITTVKFRTLMFQKAVEVFAENPIAGVGHAETMSIRIAGMPSHTHYLTLTMAYGSVGIILFVFLIISLWGPDPIRLNNNMVSLIVIFGSMTFINDLFMWYGLIAYLSSIPLSRQIRREAK